MKCVWDAWILNQSVDNHICSWIIYSDEYVTQVAVLAWGHIYTKTYGYI